MALVRDLPQAEVFATPVPGPRPAPARPLSLVPGRYREYGAFTGSQGCANRKVGTMHRLGATAICVAAIFGSAVAVAGAQGQAAETIAADLEWGVSSSVLMPSATQPERYSEAVEADLAAVATERGISQEEARARYGWQEQAARSLTALKERFPQDVAYSKMEDGSSLGLVIAFRDDVPNGAARSVSGLPVRVVLISDVGYSESEFVDAVAQVHYQSIDAFGTDLVSSGGDIEAGTIETVVDGGSARAASTVLSDRVSVGRRSIPVRLTVEPHVGGQGDVLYGGGQLSTCTAGWPVNRQTNQAIVGLTTASHCADYQRYSGRDVLVFAAAMTSTRGDVQWHQAFGEGISISLYRSF